MADPTSVSVIIASWFTPSSLFIFVNLVIGTIAITSRFSAPKRQVHHAEQLGSYDSPQLVRSPSLLERVRSFGLSYCSYEPTASFAGPECTQSQLVRTPSILERIRSFRLGHYYNYESTPFGEPESTQPELVRTPSLLERVRSFNFGLHENETSHAETEYDQAQPPEPEYPCPNQDDRKEPQLTRAPSLLQRLQSMNFSRLYRSDTAHGQEEPETECADSDPGQDSGRKVAEMEKSASERGHRVKCEWEEEDEERVEKRRPATARVETTSLGEDEEVDAKADDFINRFKKQLRLQRVDSILRYREMLRGN